MLLKYFIFFFKQKTAYEMRISDWSSDVCSSDLRSPRIDAKAIIIADLNKGFYTGAIDGRINDYRIESVGIFDIDTDADVKTAPRGGFEIVGRVRARSTKLFNSGVRDFLGGNATATSDVRYGTDGMIRFANLRMSAPRLRVTGGQG